MNATALLDRTRQLNEYLLAIMEREPRILQSEELYNFLEVHYYVRVQLSKAVRGETTPP